LPIRRAERISSLRAGPERGVGFKVNLYILWIRRTERISSHGIDLERGPVIFAQ